MEKLKKKIDTAGLSKEAKEKSLAEFNKLKLMPAMSAEATVSRNYLDWILSSEGQEIVTTLGFVPVKISLDGTEN
jgi:ATP-dependent Lon protease